MEVLGTGQIEVSVRTSSLRGLNPGITNLILRRLIARDILPGKSSPCVKRVDAGMKELCRVDYGDEVRNKGKKFSCEGYCVL